MQRSISRSVLILAVMAAVAGPTFAQGADVIVGDLNGIRNYTPSGGESAFAIGTTSCNVGTQQLLWIANVNQHPVIGQNIYRVKDGVFEQVGVSWLKHGFTALQQNLCGGCQPSGTGSRLGIQCSDPYGAGLNGSQGGLGPRWEVNPSNGAYPYPFNSPSVSGNGRRILVANGDLDPAQNAGARYFGEGHYIAPDDAVAGNGNNNASYREMTVTGPNGSGWNMGFVAPTVREEPAIMAWPTVDQFAQLHTEDVVNDGRFIVGFNAFPIGGGMYRYVYAIHNLNSDRAARKLSVNLPAGFTAQNLEFRNVPWHSGERWLSDAWAGSITASGIEFDSPHTFAGNQYGSAVRWGSTFTFIFDADMDPGAATVELFKPSASGPATFTVPAFTVFRPGWQLNGPDASMAIDNGTNDPYLGPITTEVTFGQASSVAISGEAGAGFDIFTSPVPGVPNGFVSPSGQIVNLDLTQPLTPIFGGFAPMPGAGLDLPIVAPNFPADLNAQMLVLSPSAADGFWTSAMNEYAVRLAAAPSLTSVNPTSAAAGQSVVVTGAGFRPTANVTVGGVAATVTAQTATSVTFTMPAGALGCDAPLVVANPDGQSVGGSMNPSPTITNLIAPSGYPSVGNAILAIQGTGFSANHTVTVDGANVPLLSGGATVIALRMPPHAPGNATLTITSPAGCSVSTVITYTP